MPDRARSRLARAALVALTAAASIGRGGSVASASEVFRIDSGETRAEFAVDHFWVTTLRGQFRQSGGTIVLDNDGRAGSIDFTIEASSVDTGWSVRDEFIRGERMFDAARFPQVRFRATRLEFDARGLVGASGDLTMHNVTRPVEVRIERMQCGATAGGEGRCGVAVVSSIKRSDFGMTFALPFVGDDVDLRFQLSARRVSP